MSEVPNDNLVRAAAKMLLDAKTTKDFAVCELMLKDMLQKRQIQRDLDLLKSMRAL